MCWWLNMGWREVGLEEGVVCHLFGGRTFVILLKGEEERLQVDFMTG